MVSEVKRKVVTSATLHPYIIDSMTFGSAGETRWAVLRRRVPRSRSFTLTALSQVRTPHLALKASSRSCEPSIAGLPPGRCGSL